MFLTEINRTLNKNCKYLDLDKLTYVSGKWLRSLPAWELKIITHSYLFFYFWTLHFWMMSKENSMKNIGFDKFYQFRYVSTLKNEIHGQILLPISQNLTSKSAWLFSILTQEASEATYQIHKWAYPNICNFCLDLG